MATVTLTPGVLAEVAQRFRVLAEPARLRILAALRRGEMNVTQLVAATGLSQANVSKHLRLLHDARFVARRKEGLYVFYRLADDQVFVLCDVMCGRLQQEHERRGRMLAG